MTKNIAVIPGDGIGPEIVEQAIKVLDKIGELFGHTFQYMEVDMGLLSVSITLQRPFPYSEI